MVHRFDDGDDDDAGSVVSCEATAVLEAIGGCDGGGGGGCCAAADRGCWC